ncbi:MAG: anti-sigma factor domain-containing protein [Acidimicrobiales bacterium]
MGRVLSHGAIEELLGAYALDATDRAESEAIEDHMGECPRCRAEVAQHREVAAAIGNARQEAPPDLWDRIAGSLVEAPPPLHLSLSALGTGKSRRRNAVGTGRRAVGYRSMGAVIAVAAVVIGLMGFEVVRVNNRVNSITPVVADHGLQQAATAALLNPHARRIVLASATDPRSAQAVLLPDGSGFLINSHLPPLSSDQTYQLWALIGSRRVSLGLLGNHPTDVAFRVGLRSGATLLMVTAEMAGGVVSTVHPAVVWGAIPRAT